MAKHIDKQRLASLIRGIEGISNDDRAALLELVNTRKKYGLVWEDKPEDVEERLREELPILTEVKERALINGSDNPNHILIEGDNLEALTALSYTHEGKIDVIYIDPPYNTGNKDFVYNDQFVDSEDSYRHSKWLSFMEKRLRIAKQLLSDKGVIFISIDDNEQANLKLLCDEILGNLDFLATIPWRKRTAKSDVPHNLSQDYEWVLCYCNEKFHAGIKKETRKYYETVDFPNRPWRIHDLTKQTSAEERPMSYFTIINPKTGEKFPASKNRTWCITSDTLPYYQEQNRIVYPGDYDFLNIKRPVLRYWKEDDEQKSGDFFGYTSASSYLPKEVGMTQDGTKDINAIFGDKRFGFPKPLSLIIHICAIAMPLTKDITILDFFAGSGTTFHATMQLNAEDGGHRRCILVTNNENNICEEVTYERNKRVINGYTKPNGEAVEGLHNNNLRYYRTSFVPRESSLSAKRQLMAASSDLLCIKHDIYTEKTKLGSLTLKPHIARFFEENGKQMLVIFKIEAIEKLVEEIEKMPEDTNIVTYVFSTNNYAMDADFEDVADKVTLVALPAAIYNAYLKVLPKKARPATPQPYDLTTNQQADNSTNKPRHTETTGELNFKEDTQ